MPFTIVPSAKACAASSTRSIVVIGSAVPLACIVANADIIDLSIGAVAGLASVTTAMSMDIGGVPLAIFAGVATGLIVGVINGNISTRIGIPTFLTTLAMMGVAKGTSL
jgi:ribose transport system permease protein